MILAALAAVTTITSGCASDRGPNGLVLNPVPLHLHDGSYRPFNDVNSGSLPRWSHFSSVASGDSYQSSFEHGNLMRY
jgi:hypothetical protein